MLQIAHVHFFFLFFFFFFCGHGKFELIMGMYDAWTNFAHCIYIHNRLNSFKLDACIILIIEEN